MREIRISEYDYALGEDRIAKYPLEKRDDAKLLVYDGGETSGKIFRDLPDLLDEDALVVMNNTRVIQARLHFRKATGAEVEVFLLEPERPREYERMFEVRGECEWMCMVGNLKRWKGERLKREFKWDDGTVWLTASYERAKGTAHVVKFEWDGAMSWAEVLEAVGELPIPPYLGRESEESDKRTYQTIYSRVKGSVAAPTAGLHFSEGVLKRLDEKGVEREEVTLHVGAGTFRPVKSEDVREHDMHGEYFAVRRSTVEALLRHGGRAVAVGTTTVRTLESLYYVGLRLKEGKALSVEQWEPYEVEARLTTREALEEVLRYMDRRGVDEVTAETRVIIVPGYEWKMVEGMVTNFHQPRSTLLLLVAAFIGEDWRRVYDYALRNGFRFLSYGDASLLKR